MSYINGGEVTGGDDGGYDRVGQNPTGRPRKSSRRTRAKKDRRLFKGSPWAKPEDTKGKDSK